MKKLSRALAACALIAAAGYAGTAMAHVSVGIYAGAPAPIYYQPPPVVYVPGPYYGPQVVYGEPRRDRRDYWRERREWRERQWHRERDREGWEHDRGHRER